MNKTLSTYIATKYDGNVSAFARAMGLTPGRVHHWFTGRCRVPGREAARISQTTGLPLEAILLPREQLAMQEPGAKKERKR